MGLRGYFLKRTANTILLIVFVIFLNFVIFELMPGQQGSFDTLVQNPKISQADKKAFIIAEEQRLGIICDVGSPGHPDRNRPPW